MAVVRLEGVHIVRKKLASGKVAVYHYAWRGGPRLKARPGTPEYIREFQSHAQEKHAPDPSTLQGLIADYKQAAEFKTLAEATRKEMLRYMDDIMDNFGPTTALRMFDDKRMRGHVRKWRDTMLETPRKADYSVSTLRRVLSFGIDNGDLTINVASRIGRLHSADRSEIIWDNEEIDAFCEHASEALQRAFQFARLTGLRRSDMLSIPWTADKGTHLLWKTSKSRRRGMARITVIIPITAELRAVMGDRPQKDAVTIITGEKGRPWTPDGFATVFQRAKKAAGVTKRLHDLRGNAATALCLAGLDDREVAEIVGWKEGQVAKIRRLYVDRERLIQAAVHRLERNK